MAVGRELGLKAVGTAALYERRLLTRIDRITPQATSEDGHAQRPAIRRPVFDHLVGVGVPEQLLVLAYVDTFDVDVVRGAALRRERQPPAIGGPRRAHVRCRRSGEL